MRHVHGARHGEGTWLNRKDVYGSEVRRAATVGGYGTTASGMRQNAAFCVSGSSTVT